MEKLKNYLEKEKVKSAEQLAKQEAKYLDKIEFESDYESVRYDVILEAFNEAITVFDSTYDLDGSILSPSEITAELNIDSEGVDAMVIQTIKHNYFPLYFWVCCDPYEKRIILNSQYCNNEKDSSSYSLEKFTFEVLEDYIISMYNNCKDE